MRPHLKLIFCSALIAHISSTNVAAQTAVQAEPAPAGASLPPVAAAASVASSTPAPRLVPISSMRGPFLKPVNDCPQDPSLYGENDPDVRLVPNPQLSVAFHGNRFVIAREVIAAFENANPGSRISYTAIPPIFSVKALTEGGVQFPGGRVFNPDIYMGPPMLGSMKILGASPGQEFLVQHGLHSQVNGLVLVARSDDSRIPRDAKWDEVLRHPALRLSLPGDQEAGFTLLDPIRKSLGDDLFRALPNNPLVGVSRTRHHRSIPSRILAKCDDVGVQFLQSKQDLESAYPGKFKFIDIPISEDSKVKQQSYLFSTPRAATNELAMKFLAFVQSDEVKAILLRYSLIP
jgi:hypothetical protein